MCSIMCSCTVWLYWNTVCLLYGCMYRNAIQASTLLLEAGADVNSRNAKRSITPIMITGAVGHFDLLEIMASHHTADVNVQVRIYTHISYTCNYCKGTTCTAYPEKPS